ncbi:SapC family protein [Ectothiorhodospira sp. PHS-1]|uniref:SapC family protein n=1 Tax=Ectothiorhodospira sp. PHS-1 TaxID=519989 RepID=UPI00024A8A0E|nr:SapC family protein [Ectothiorhodospira sp. PHS-1]EHQ53685.1 SapC family protein [Ectothiorhodospira sp. PHS-1]
MPNYQAITKNDFAHLRWKRFDSYRFAAQDAVAPLVAQELARACMSLPIAFIRQNEAFIPAVLQGFKPGQNLLVAPDGRWIGPYTPAAYRGYPFALAQAADDQLVLCVDTDSGLVGENEQEAFFEDTGEPAKPLKDVLSFLRQVRNNRELTPGMCAALEAHGLIVPWPLKIKTESGEQAIQGLYRIDEEALNALDRDAFDALRQTGALPLIYCQLLSMQHIQTLGKLAEAHAKVTSAPASLDTLFGEDGDTLKFDFH